MTSTRTSKTAGRGQEAAHITTKGRRSAGIEVTYGRLVTLIGAEEAAIAKRDSWYETFEDPIKGTIYVYEENSTIDSSKRRRTEAIDSKRKVKDRDDGTRVLQRIVGEDYDMPSSSDGPAPAPASREPEKLADETGTGCDVEGAPPKTTIVKDDDSDKGARDRKDKAQGALTKLLAQSQKCQLDYLKYKAKLSKVMTDKRDALCEALLKQIDAALPRMNELVTKCQAEISDDADMMNDYVVYGKITSTQGSAHTLEEAHDLISNAQTLLQNINRLAKRKDSFKDAAHV